MDEREKLRKFRELDDAFADALRELERPASDSDMASDPAVRARMEQAPQHTASGHEAPRAVADEQTRQGDFEQRLEVLMREYAQSAENVRRLLETLQALGRVA